MNSQDKTGEKPTPGEYLRYRDDLKEKQKASLLKHWPWYLLLGISLTILGIVGLGMIPVMTITTVAVFGIFFTVAGVLLLIAGISGYGGWFLITLGIIDFLVGTTMLEEPVSTIKLVTLVIGGGFIVSGIIRDLVGSNSGNSMLFLAGILDVVLGGLILAHWPESSPWVIGLFVSVELLTAGLSFIALSLSARKLKNNPPAGV
ncbi:HdeD family acid-resistance protein [Thermococcus sp.]|uniref:HdeD family acid-resistance protein n=1 Tax=Thermococcus sp. TaxID=35749 RepID=UPI00260D400E|nr:DUF308 domain-containing protein [Thermococcus sp.]